VLPPGPRSPAWLQTARFVRNPRAFTRDMCNRFGDAVRFHMINGRGVAFASPSLAREVFAADPETFGSSAMLSSLFGRHSLLATSQSTHRRQRKLLAPYFHGARIKSVFEGMRRVVRAHATALGKAARDQAVVVIRDLAQAATLDVILESVFGADPELDRPAARTVLVDLVHAITPSIAVSPKINKPLYPPWRRFLRRRAAFDAWVDRQLVRRRRGRAGDDVLGMLVDARYDDGECISDAEIRDQLMTLLLAGHETSAVAISWGVYWLLKYPATLEALRRAIDPLGGDASAEALARLPYLDAVVAETLRVEPVVVSIERLCRRPLRVGPWTVPEGEIAVVNLLAILGDPDVFPEPGLFRPERFLQRQYSAAEFVPFGGGQRRCLGAAFAEAEIAIALGTILGDWNLELASTKPERAVRRNVTMGPAGGVRVRVLGRRRPEETRPREHDAA
jgi:cytochrome P450 family 110